MPQPPQAPVQPEFQAFTEGYTAGLRAALDLVPHCSHPFAAGSDHTVRTHQPDDCARCQLGAALTARAPYRKTGKAMRAAVLAVIAVLLGIAGAAEASPWPPSTPRWI